MVATAALCDLAQNASIELAPRGLSSNAVAEHFPAGCELYVPFPSNATWRETVAACRILLTAGTRPVPHLTARSIGGVVELRARLAQLEDTGVDRLLLVAGDDDHAAGPYRDTPDVLESGLLAEYGFDRLGVAAHPEGHPQAKPADLERALARKMEYAAATGAEMWIVTQFAFASAAVIAWLEHLMAVDHPLPVRVGLAGPARRATLLAFAARCGVRVSARMVSRHRGIVRLLGNYAPDNVVQALARHRVANPATPFDGIHLFAFGGMQASSRWLRALGMVPAATASRRDCAAEVLSLSGEHRDR